MLLKVLNRRSTFAFLATPKFLKFAKRGLALFLIATFVYSTFHQTQAVDTVNPFEQIRNAQKVDKPNLENYKNYSTITDIYNISSYLGVPQGQTEQEIRDQMKKGLGYIPEGALGATSQLIAKTYTPAASGIEYLAQMKDQILGRPAYAQAGSFTSLQPLLPIWRGFRNMVYLLSSLLFILVGLMIIFRLKINPQTVVSIQSAIPQVIMTLILVTFSYAIAGLLIDLVNLVQGIALATLFSSMGKGFTDNLFTSGPITYGFPSNIPGIGFFDYLKSIGLPFSFTSLASNNLGTLVNLIIALTPRFALALLGGIIGGLAGTAGAIATGGAGFPLIAGGAMVGAAVVTFVLGVIILFTLIKLLIGLFKCYLHVVLKIIMAPIEIGLGAVPSMKIGFSSWITDLFAQLMVFPTVLLFLVIANLISQSSMIGTWAPGILYTPDILGISILPTAIGIAALLLVSQLPELIPQIIFSLKPSAWETAIGKGAANIPIASGFINNTKASFGKAQGDATLKLVGAGLTALGIGARSAQNNERPANNNIAK